MAYVFFFGFFFYVLLFEWQDFVGDIDDHSPNIAAVRGLGDELTVNRMNQYGADTILGQLAQTGRFGIHLIWAIPFEIQTPCMED